MRFLHRIVGIVRHVFSATHGQDLGVWVLIHPVPPTHLFPYRQLPEHGPFHLPSDGLTTHDSPVGIRLHILHDERAVHQPARSLKVDFTVTIFSVVHDGRIRERSPHGCKSSVANLIVYNFMTIEQVQAVSPGMAIDNHTQDV